jgi:hypothetical protein
MKPIKLTPADLFKSAPHPGQIRYTFNWSFKSGATMPKGWGANSDTLRSVATFDDPEWVENGGHPDGNVVVICPAYGLEGDYRRQTDDARCTTLGMDFDNPKAPLLKDMLALLGDYDGVAYQTRSHQKDKKGIVCDRFRILMAYSRPVTNDENHRIHNLLASVIHHDHSCGDVARIFYPTSPGCYHAPLGGVMAVDVDHLLMLAGKCGIKVSIVGTPLSKAKLTRITGTGASSRPAKPRDMMEEILSSSQGNIDWSKGVIDKNLKRSLSWTWTHKYKDDCDSQTYNTRDAVWALMHRALEQTTDLPTIAKTFEEMKWFRDWVTRSGEDYRAKLIEAYSIFLTQTAGRFVKYSSLMPVRKIENSDLTQLPLGHAEALTRFRKFHNYAGTAEQTRTHQSLQYAITCNRAILDIACGLEKSVAATAFAASTCKTRQVWLVCEHHQACRDTMQRLQVMGVEECDIGYITGWHESVCSYADKVGQTPRKKLYNKKKTPCRKCDKRSSCAFAARLWSLDRQMRKPVIVMTHAMFVCLPPWWALKNDYGIDDPVVIIDEQLRRWQQGTFRRSHIESVLRMSGHDATGILNEVDAACAATGVITSHGQILTGVGVIPRDVGVHSRSHAIKAIHAADMPDEETSEAMAIVSLLRTTANRFVIRSGDKYSILADSCVWVMPKTCIMLDGSARYTQCHWDGFVVLDGGRAGVEGLQVHVMRGNATQSSIKDAVKFGRFEAWFKNVLNGVSPRLVMFAVNRSLGLYTGASPSDLHAFRGTDTRGSNGFLDCNAAVIIMSLFTDVNDYALRAALAEGGPIEADAIWRSNGTPKLDKSGWVDERLHVAFVRQAIDECYQTVMRIGVRRYDKGEYLVACRLPDSLCVDELETRLPGARFVMYGFATGKKANAAQAKRNLFVLHGGEAIRALDAANASLEFSITARFRAKYRKKAS